MTKTNKKAISKAITRSTTVKAAIAKVNTKSSSKSRDRQREEDIRISFHNGMLAGLAQVKREIKDDTTSKAIDRIQNRVITHRDTRMHSTSRWYVGSCRDALKRSAKKRGE